MCKNCKLFTTGCVCATIFLGPSQAKEKLKERQKKKIARECERGIVKTKFAKHKYKYFESKTIERNAKENWSLVVSRQFSLYYSRWALLCEKSVWTGQLAPDNLNARLVCPRIALITEIFV